MSHRIGNCPPSRVRTGNREPGSPLATTQRRRLLLGPILGLTLLPACAGGHGHPPATVVAKPIPVAPTSTMIVPEPEPVPEPVPASAPVSPLPYTVVPVPLPLKIAPIIVSIDGTKPDDVWLLGVERLAIPDYDKISHLFHSDGKQTQLIQHNLCNRANDGSWIFVRVHASKSGVDLDGPFRSARRNANGALKCNEPSTIAPTAHYFAWTAGDPIAIEQGFGYLNITGPSWVIGALGPAGLTWPEAVAIAPHGTHGWVVLWAVLADTGTEADPPIRLVEWTGMRWRERQDVLPSGVSPSDIVALSATAGGAYFGVTRKQLLTYDGERFQSSPVPEGFEPERFYASDNEGLWVFGPHRVWRFYHGTWESIAIPLLHTNAYWLAPQGEVWISGSNVLASDIAYGEELADPTPGANNDPKALNLEQAAARVIRLVPSQESRSGR